MEFLENIGLIPAAGRGLRMGLPFPKELFPVFSEDIYRPIAFYSVDRIRQAGAQHIVFIINETKHQVLDYFGSGENFQCHFSYVVQGMNQSTLKESTSPGLAHALDAAYHLTKGKRVLFSMADTIVHPRSVFVKAIQDSHPDTDVTLNLFLTDHPEKYGMVRFDPHEGQVLEIVDKPSSTELKWMWGSIVWGPKFTEFLHTQITKGHVFDFALIMNQAIQSGLKFQSIQFGNGNYIDIGTFDDAQSLYPQAN